MTTGSGVRWVSAKGRTQLHVVSKVEEGYWPMNTTPCCYSNNTGWKLRQGGVAVVVVAAKRCCCHLSLCYAHEAVLRPARQSSEFEWFRECGCLCTHCDTS